MTSKLKAELLEREDLYGDVLFLLCFDLLYRGPGRDIPDAVLLRERPDADIVLRVLFQAGDGTEGLFGADELLEDDVIKLLVCADLDLDFFDLFAVLAAQFLPLDHELFL